MLTIRRFTSASAAPERLEEIHRLPLEVFRDDFSDDDWERWQGPTFARDGAELIRTEEDEGVMVLRFGPSESIDLRAPISCEARAGDDW